MKRKILAAALLAGIAASLMSAAYAADSASLAVQRNPEDSVSDTVLSTNQETIWFYFKDKGFTDEGIAGIMGNLEAESGYLPNNLENTAEKKGGMDDEEFTAAVDDGTITRDEFISSTRFGVCSAGGSQSGTEYGYGLAQWTYTSRKAGLYDFAKDRGVSIADLNMQLDYIYKEMGSTLREYMTTADNVSDACLYFHNKYEGSADDAGRIAGRISRAEAVYALFHGVTAPAPDTENPVISDIQITNVTSTGYTITCKVTDNCGIASVTFPTWSEPNGNDDLVNTTGTVSGTTAACTVSISDHGGQTNCNYITQVTATDTSGNSVTVTGATVYVEPLANGWVNSEGFWYYYIEGVPVTGWQKIGGNWYCMNADGVMLTGWQSISDAWYYFGGSGVMRTGWQQIDSAWYYFGNSGVMRTGWQQIDSAWYYFGNSGVMRTDWQQINGAWYFFGGSGIMRTGWVQIGGSWYYLRSSGAMVTGWVQIGGTWYYFSASGAMYADKWVSSGGNWYYMKASGAMAKSETLTISGKSYTFDANGVMQ